MPVTAAFDFDEREYRQALREAWPFRLTFTHWLRRAQARKALDHDPSLRGTQLRTVDAQGLHIAGAGYAPSLHWHDLARVTETRHFFLFFEDDRVWHYLPKRALTDVERDSLRNLIQANCRP
ncbi:MAG TPA: YcxB family protein [Gemmatimonadaceae bacterium]|nr:YcxB family protein [Gemmatimonadaceae bacterium]